MGVRASQSDKPRMYHYGSLPAKPELGHVLVIEESGNRYAVIRIEGEGLVGDGPFDQREMALAWAEISRGETVPTLWLQKLDVIETRVQGRSFSPEELKEYSQKNREIRLSASAK